MFSDDFKSVKFSQIEKEIYRNHTLFSYAPHASRQLLRALKFESVLNFKIFRLNSNLFFKFALY